MCIRRSFAADEDWDGMMRVTALRTLFLDFIIIINNETNNK